MKLFYSICFISVLFLFSCKEQSGFSQKTLEKWSQDPALTLNEATLSSKALSKNEVIQATDLITKGWKIRNAEKYRKAWSQKTFNQNNLKMLFDYRIFGEKPSDGRSLYISMHGGGNAPAAVNNQQWYNQIRLYEPQEGVYVAPRAPWDDWNMWFKPGLDEFFEDIIRATVALLDVNPDKVYLLGYSAGGDGVWRMAPRMADRWAAASMMAGHPGEASQVNLRNLPFMIWMGELDGAYDRNKLAAEKGLVLDSLQQKDPEGYIHETHIVKGKSHWMDRVDSAAISWMAQYHRNPFPEKITWRQENVVRPSLYWLETVVQDAKPGMEAIVEHQGNTFTILKNDYKELTIALNDTMIDFERPVEIIYQENKIFSGKINRTLKDIYQSMEKREDEKLLFSARLTIHENLEVK